MIATHDYPLGGQVGSWIVECLRYLRKGHLMTTYFPGVFPLYYGTAPPEHISWQLDCLGSPGTTTLVVDYFLPRHTIFPLLL